MHIYPIVFVHGHILEELINLLGLWWSHDSHPSFLLLGEHGRARWVGYKCECEKRREWKRLAYILVHACPTKIKRQDSFGLFNVGPIMPTFTDERESFDYTIEDERESFDYTIENIADSHLPHQTHTIPMQTKKE